MNLLGRVIDKVCIGFNNILNGIPRESNNKITQPSSSTPRKRKLIRTETTQLRVNGSRKNSY